MCVFSCCVIYSVRKKKGQILGAGAALHDIDSRNQNHHTRTDGHGQVGKSAARFFGGGGEAGEETRQDALAILLGLASGAQNFWYFAKEHLDRAKKEKPKRVGFNSHQ